MNKRNIRIPVYFFVVVLLLVGIFPMTSIQAAERISYYIKINRKQNCITIYQKDSKGNYNLPVKAMACSVGLNNATPLGKFKLQEKYQWHELDGGVYGQYCSRITGHILFHSVYYKDTKKNTLYYSAYNKLGTTASHGCVRLCVADAKWIYDNCSSGTIVEIYDSDEPGPLGKPVSIRIGENSPYRGWDPTDPDPSNPWTFKPPTLKGVKKRTIERGSNKSELLVGVEARDFADNPIDVEVKGRISLTKCGEYKLLFQATDVLGQTTKKQVIISVKDRIAPTITRIKKKWTISEDKNDYQTHEKLTKEIKQNLLVRDSGVELGKKYLRVDDEMLWHAWKNHIYGLYKINVYAIDKAGNSSKVKTIVINYEKPKDSYEPVELPPEIDDQSEQEDGEGENMQNSEEKEQVIQSGE